MPYMSVKQTTRPVPGYWYPVTDPALSPRRRRRSPRRSGPGDVMTRLGAYDRGGQVGPLCAITAITRVRDTRQYDIAHVFGPPCSTRHRDNDGSPTPAKPCYAVPVERSGRRERHGRHDQSKRPLDIRLKLARAVKRTCRPERERAEKNTYII